MAVQFGAFGEIEHWEPNPRREPMKIHEDGSFEVIVLQLDVPSPRTGKIYNSQDIKRLINDPSFKHRVEGGFMTGEYSPRFRDSINRMMEVRLERVCAQYKNIRIQDGELLAELIPFGPFSDALVGKVYQRDFDVAMRATVRTVPINNVYDVAGLISIDVVTPFPVDKRY